jgi:hypothetical protein
MADRQSSVSHESNPFTGLHEWKPLFRWAGAASVLFVLLLIAALVLDFLAPPPVHGGAGTLEFIAATR